MISKPPAACFLSLRRASVPPLPRTPSLIMSLRLDLEGGKATPPASLKARTPRLSAVTGDVGGAKRVASNPLPDCPAFKRLSPATGLCSKIPLGSLIHLVSCSYFQVVC